MKNLCYNRGTKDKNRQNLFESFSLKRRTVRCTINFQAEVDRRAAAGTRQNNYPTERL